MAPFSLPGGAKRGGAAGKAAGWATADPAPLTRPRPGLARRRSLGGAAPAWAPPGTLREALAFSFGGFRPLRTLVSPSVQGLEGTRGVRTSRVLAQETS